MDVYDVRSRTLVGEGAGRSPVASGRQSAAAAFMFGVIIKNFILEIVNVLFLIRLIRL